MIDMVLSAAEQPWVYAVVVLCCLVDGFFPPVPSESLVVALASVASATMVAGTGSWHGMWLLLAAATLGAFLGDNLAYLIGRRAGTPRCAWMRRPLMQRAFDKVERELKHRGASIILMARFVPVARVAVNLGAGTARYPYRKFLAVSGLSATLWSCYSLAIGALAGTWLPGNPLLGMVVAIVAAGLIGLLLDRVPAAFRSRNLRNLRLRAMRQRPQSASGADRETADV